jgi:uncharacterized protein (TIGR02391 family)
MLLTDGEIREIRRTIEDQAGLNEELLRRCGDLIHIGNHDEAVRSACVFLEERLRKAANEEKLMGVQLAKYAFDPDTGSIAKHLASNKSEREGLYSLYIGVFKLFRNPTAHGVVGYSAAEAKAIIGFVNLLLTFLDRVEELPPPGSFPENVERAMATVDEKIGPGVASRLRMFLGKCRSLGLEPTKRKGSWVPFRRHALLEMEGWDKPRSYPLNVFYLIAEEKNQGFWFPVNQYYTRVADFDLEQLSENLRDLGFAPTGKYRDFQISLQTHNDQVFFDALLDLVKRTCQELEDTLP